MGCLCGKCTQRAGTPGVGGSDIAPAGGRPWAYSCPFLGPRSPRILTSLTPSPSLLLSHQPSGRSLLGHRFLEQNRTTLFLLGGELLTELGSLLSSVCTPHKQGPGSPAGWGSGFHSRRRRHTPTGTPSLLSVPHRHSPALSVLLCPTQKGLPTACGDLLLGGVVHCGPQEQPHLGWMRD